MRSRLTQRFAPRSAALLVALFLSRGALAADCSRPTDESGAGGYAYGAAKVSSLGNARVLVWYTTEGEHAVNPASSRSDGVPDDVASALSVTTDALSGYAAQGYRAPLSDELAPECGENGGDARFDVYLMNMRGADGMTVPETGRCTSHAPEQCASYLVAKSNFADYYDTAEIGIRTVLPHETFHAVQNAYDVELDRFWAEGTAQWATKVLYPELTDLERNLPAFFSQTSRSLEAQPSGVTAGFLYGSAIWPVFLSERFGSDVVRLVLEQEAIAGDPAIVAADTVLQTLNSSIAQEYPLFSVWNSATGTRTGTGGYEHAASYPLVSLVEVSRESTNGITSGLDSFFYHALVTAPAQLTLETDSSRNTALLVPFEDGLPRVDRVTPLPAQLESEGIVVVSGITTKKTDGPFTLSVTRPAPPSDGGCAVSNQRKPQRALALLFVPLALLGRRRVRARSARALRTAQSRRG